MKVGQAIRENLSVCGDCNNCKLVVWGNDANKKDLMRNVSSVSFENDDGETERGYYIVNCAWLKYAVPEPDKLTKCEGKKGRE